MAVDMDCVRLTVELSNLTFRLSDLPPGNEKLITRGGDPAMMPLFFVCRNGTRLFICVDRGTDPSDFLLAFDFKPENFMGGQAHRGVLRAARGIIAQSRRYVDECLDSIICTGYALGGAIAGMVAAVLTLEEHRQDVKAICHGPFPFLSENLAQRLENTVTSFVFRDDIIPRMSSANLTFHDQFISRLSPNPRETISWIMNTLWGSVERIRSLDQDQLVQLSDRATELLRIVRAGAGPAYFLPGRVYLLDTTQTGQPSVRRYNAEDAKLKDEQLVNCFRDHHRLYREVLSLLDALA
jgi:hypothetical protein